MVRSPSPSDNSSHALPKRLSGRTIFAAIISTTTTDTPIINSSIRLAGYSVVKDKRGQPKKIKFRNLLQRLQNYKSDILISMKDDTVTFTHNLGENDLRMAKIQHKTSGCFRRTNGAKMILDFVVIYLVAKQLI
jgi:hypothetical protein